MKKLITTLFSLLALAYAASAQVQVSDSVKEALDNHQGKLNALDERVLVNEADLAKLNKIKVSGYVQAQWDSYQSDLYKTNEPGNTFYIRRARVKFTYEATDGVKFVLQPDFSTGNFALKDAYAVLNIPKLKGWQLWAGQFNRPDYEVEYSSGSREIVERSRVVKAIYPGEREVGAKLEYSGTNVPVLFQLAALNGNFTGSQQKDADSKKDIMARFVYMAKLPSAGLGIDFGVNGYFGGVRAKSNKYVSETSGIVDSINVGDYLKKQWFGGEVRIYSDLLGGTSIKAEYIAGTNSSASTTAVKTDPNKIRNFSGYYIYLIKNIGNKNQFVARYDFYDPNTKLSGDNAKSDFYYKSWNLAWQYYLNDNIRISLNYDMPVNEKDSAVKNANGIVTSQLKDNTFTVRVQAKF
jgi:phosphate-selective porin